MFTVCATLIVINSRIYSLLQTETLCPLSKKSPFPPPQSLVTSNQLLVSMNLLVLYILYKRNHTIFVRVWLLSLSACSDGPALFLREWVNLMVRKLLHGVEIASL